MTVSTETEPAAPAAGIESQTAPPAAPAQPTAPAPQQPAPTPPASPLDARRAAEAAMHERLRQLPTREPGTVDARGRTHARQDGTYMTEGEGDAGEETGAATSAAPETPPPAGEKTPPAEGTPAEGEPAAEPPQPLETVEIELSEDHPLRDQGITKVPAYKGQEDAVRSLLNNPVRRSQVEATQRQLSERQERVDTLEGRVRQLQAERDVLAEQIDSLFQNPEVVQRFNEIAESLGDDAAKQYLDGLRVGQSEKIQAKLGELNQTAEIERAQAATEEFARTAYMTGLGRYPEWWTSTPEYETALRGALTELDQDWAAAQAAGRMPGFPTAEAAQNYAMNHLIRLLDARFMADPAASQRATADIAARQQQPPPAGEKSEVEKRLDALEAENQQLKEQLETGNRRRTINPIGGLNRTARSDRGTANEEPPDLTQFSPTQIKKMSREGVLASLPRR